MSRRQWRLWIGALVGLTVLGGAVVWLARDSEPEPRSRQYRAFTSCLLTDDQGISGVVAAPVWAGMQETSVTTLTKVQHLSVVGPQTADNAAAFVAGLTQSQCDLVILVGEAPSAAAVAAAGRFPNQRFLAVGNRVDGTPQNLVWVTGSSDAIRNGVQQAIRDSAG